MTALIITAFITLLPFCFFLSGFTAIVLWHRFFPRNDLAHTLFLGLSQMATFSGYNTAWMITAFLIGCGTGTTWVIFFILGAEILVCHVLLMEFDGFRRPSLNASHYNSKLLPSHPYRTSIQIHERQDILDRLLYLLEQRSWSAPLYKD